MAEERMARYLRQPNKVERYDVDLSVLRATAETPIATLGLRTKILVSAGAYSLVFVFGDTSTLTISSTEVSTGDILDFEFAALYVLNAPQPGVTLTLLVDKRI